jgi:hypothetical protein
VQTVRRRAISYWDCYYREDLPQYSQVPAIACIDWLLAAGP